MIKISKIKLFLLCLWIIILPEHAHSYFDPGTGSILLQVIIAFIGGVIIFFHNIMFQIKRLPEKLNSYFRHQKTLSEHYLLASSIGIYAGLFYSSHNIQELSILSFILNIFLFLFSSLLLTVICTIALQKREGKDKILCGLLFLLLTYLMRVPILEIAKIFYIDMLGKSPTNLVGTIFVTILIFVTLLVGRYIPKHTLKVVIILSSMSILPVFKIAKGVYISLSYKQSEKIAKDQFHLDADDIIFYRKPNVYFILFDAYSNGEGLEAVGLSTSPQLMQYLDANKLTAYPKFYTNMQSTRHAISTYFSMNIKLGSKILYDISLDRKQRICGGDNPVFSLFKDNGYYTQIIMADAEEFNLNAHMRNGYCFASLCTQKEGNFLSNYFSIFDRIVLNSMLKLTYVPSDNYNYINMQVLQEALQGSKKETGQFVYVHFMPPGHSVTTQVDGKGECNEEEETQKYDNRLKLANTLIVRSVDMIRQFDPESLIILASDTGAFILNRCSYSAPLTTREEVVERQGAFLAIRWGKDYDGRYDKDIKSSANLFRYIFSYLMGHEKLLENKPDDDAFYQYKGEIIKSIDNGVILPPPADELKKE